MLRAFRRATAELPGLERLDARKEPARNKSFERTPPTNRGFRLAGAKRVANASVCSLRAVCGRRSIPPLAYGENDD